MGAPRTRTSAARRHGFIVVVTSVNVPDHFCETAANGEKIMTDVSDALRSMRPAGAVDGRHRAWLWTISVEIGVP
jgi:hypothetical protein